MKKIYVLNGPNLNLLGKREPDIYGHESLDDVKMLCQQACHDGFEIVFLQSNHEGQLIDWVQEACEQEACEQVCGIVINPAGFSHSSVALMDALNNFKSMVIEVHISQIHKREPFRHHSYVALRADAVIAGLGIKGYAAAVNHICTSPNHV